jgi:hypothetical protein
LHFLISNFLKENATEPRMLRSHSSELTNKESINMSVNAALFVFLAAAVVAVFAFCSIVVWVSTPARERQARDRIALMKTLAENPSENSAQILELLRADDEKRTERREHEEKKGYVIGGLIVMAVGLGLGVMLAILDNRGGAWSVGLIPFLIGCVLLGVGLATNRTERSPDKEAK